MVTLRIVAWKTEAGWTSIESYLPRALPRRLAKDSRLGGLAVKRLVRQLVRHDLVEIACPNAEDRFEVDSLISLLESCGAALEIVESDEE